MNWQPIEVAPKDARILLAWPDRVSVGQWKENWRTGLSYFSESDELDDYAAPIDQPTHWMPLPEAPSAKIDESRLMLVLKATNELRSDVEQSADAS